MGTEAAFHHIHEYMTHVKDYYDHLALTTPIEARRVYLATDDANVSLINSDLTYKKITSPPCLGVRHFGLRMMSLS